MRTASAILALLLLGSPAIAQQPAAPAAKPAAKPVAPQGAKQVYAAMSDAERTAIQSDLAWTGDYNGLVNGVFDDRSVTAVKAFQKRQGGKDTGNLNPQEREALAAAAKTAQDRVGWRVATDPVTGARVGIPGKLAPQTAPGKNGTRWSSQLGQVQIETFRVNDAGTTLQSAYDQQRKQPVDRKIEYNVLRPDFFVISGTQGLKKFYLRGEFRNGEVRGLTILYDQAMEGIMEPVVVVMSSAFVPFPGNATAAAAPPPKKKVDYGTGIVVSGLGHILADRQVTDSCSTIVVAGVGDAERVADDPASNLALLRVYGAALAPLALGDAGKSPDVTLIGIADPQSQGGASGVSRIPAKLNGLAVEPGPPPGFSGAAALDGERHLVGLVQLKQPLAAGPAPAASAAGALVPSDAIRKFLAASSAAPSDTTPADATGSVVRIICVRK